ncbi:MAG TPA: hypothetical protein VKE88_03115 [Candidatus Nanoarchaeia archaeon]|nr:hypothetical protein [Candidatus Nanoarchaeia archaeon]
MSSTIPLEKGLAQASEAVATYAKFSHAQQNTFKHVWNGAEKELKEQGLHYIATVPFKIANSLDFHLLVGMANGSWKVFYATVPVEVNCDGGDASLRVDVSDKHESLERAKDTKHRLEEVLNQYK